MHIVCSLFSFRHFKVSLSNFLYLLLFNVHHMSYYFLTFLLFHAHSMSSCFHDFILLPCAHNMSCYFPAFLLLRAHNISCCFPTLFLFCVHNINYVLISYLFLSFITLALSSLINRFFFIMLLFFQHTCVTSSFVLCFDNCILFSFLFHAHFFHTLSLISLLL